MALYLKFTLLTLSCYKYLKVENLALFDTSINLEIMV